jgi:hypothetical protein
MMAMRRNRKSDSGSAAPAAGSATGRAVGKRSQTSAIAPQVQARGNPQAAGAEVQRVAEKGVAGAGGSLPHADRIQAAFGRHDVSGVRAQVGGEAARANEQMQSSAYAYGDAVGFAGAPDLHTAAHEAAHVVQQRSGVNLPGGVGTPGDSYERHADVVADLVVSGESAEAALDQAGGGGGSPGVQHDGPDQEPAGESAIETLVEDLGPGFRSTVGTLIEAQAGAVGSELEIACTVRVPVYRALWVSGRINMQVSHGAEGYKIKARPAIGASLGSGGRGNGFVDLFANYTVEAQAASGERVVDMVSLALEAETRAMRDEPPPMLLGVFMSAVGGQALSLLDNLDRAVNWAQGEGYTSSFWPWLADCVWGEGHMTQVMEGMEENEFAQTLDEGSLSGSASGGDDDLEASVSGRLGVGQRRRIAREPGSSEATETEDVMFNFKLAVGIGPAGGEVEISVPLTRGGRGGTFKGAVSATFDTSGAGGWNIAVDNLVEVIRIAVREIQQYLQDNGSNQSLEAAMRQLEQGERELRGEFYQQGHNAVWNLAAITGMAERGFEVSAELNLDSQAWKFALTAVDEIDESEAGQSFTLTRKRAIVEVTTGG